MQQQRDQWVDFARGIGILLVVYGHIARGLYNAGLPLDVAAYTLADSVIYCFHMPLFFFLSGLYFYPSLHKNGRASLIRDKFATLAYPYLLWSLIQGGVELVASHYTNSQTSFADLYSILWHPHAQFWFLYILLLIFILMALLSPATHAARWMLLPLATIIWATQLWMHWPFPFDFLVNYWLYFMLGCVFPDCAGLFKERPALLTLCSTVAFTILAWYFHGPAGLIFSDYSWLHLPLACSGIAMVCGFSMLLDKLPASYNRWLLVCGVCSMPVYLMHILVGSGVRIVLSKLAHVQNSAVHLLLGMLLAVWLPVVFYRWTQRHAPGKLGWLFKLPASLRGR